MSQRQQLERILSIDRSIRNKEYPSADTLAVNLNVSRRVIFNDRKFMLERLGAPIAFDNARGGWYHTEPNWSLPATMITEGELLAFFLSVEVAQRQLGTALEASLHQAVNKIARSLPDPALVNLEALRQHFTFAAPHSAITEPSTLIDLHRAILERQRLSINYYTASRNQDSHRIVDPHSLHNDGGDWYLIAYDHLRSRMRTFHAGRIRNYLFTGHTFQIRSGFNATALLSSSFSSELSDREETVSIRFDANQAPYIRERQWHPTQSIVVHTDGGLTLTFRTSGITAVKRWLLQYGRHAVVLKPAHLRREMFCEIEAMMSNYHQSATASANKVIQKRSRRIPHKT